MTAMLSGNRENAIKENIEVFFLSIIYIILTSFQAFLASLLTSGPDNCTQVGVIDRPWY